MGTNQMSITVWTVTKFGRDGELWINSPTVFTDKAKAYAYYRSVSPWYREENDDEESEEDVVDGDHDDGMTRRIVSPGSEITIQLAYSIKRPCGACIAETVVVLPTVRLDFASCLRNLKFIKIAYCRRLWLNDGRFSG